MEDWLSGTADRGWLLITGSPGSGKSAVLSHFIAAREKLGQPVPQHFLRRGVADWDYPYAVQSSLVQQIEALFPSSFNPDARPERRLVELLLRISNRQLIPSHQRLLLVVDGLNEAVAEGSDNPLPRFLPQALPPGVFLVCSIRSGHPYLSFFAERSFRCIDLDRGVDGKHRASQALWAYHGPRLGLNMFRPRIHAPRFSKPRAAKASSTPVVPSSFPNRLRWKVRVGQSQPCSSVPPSPSGWSRLCSAPAP